MTLSSLLSIGQSGLAASQAALRQISDNVANVNTPGYARRTVDLEAAVASGVGAGVRVADVRRIADRYLEAASAAAAGDDARFAQISSVLEQLQGLLGDPAASSSLPARLDAVQAAAIDLAADAGDPARRRLLVERLGAAIDELRQLSSDVADLQQEARSGITVTIDRANVLLDRIDRLNGEVAAARLRGDATGAEDLRQQAVDELAGLIGIRVTETPDGRLAVSTADGEALIDHRLRRIDPVDLGLDVLDADGATVLRDGTLRATSGKLGGLLELADHVLPDFQQNLGGLFAGLARTLNAAAAEASAVPPPNALTGLNTGLLPTDQLGFIGAAVFAVTDAAGVVVARTRVDLGAVATVGDLIAAVNAGLGGTAVASFDNGTISIRANNASQGVVVANDPAQPSSRDGAGLAAWFGIGALVRTDAVAQRPSGLQPGDSHGFQTGETVALTLRAADGRLLGTYGLSPVSGGSLGDLMAAINASPLGAFGSASLDSAGRLSFIDAGGTALQLGSTSDSTSRGDTGIGFSELFGIGGGSDAALRAATLDPSLLADARRLPLARFDAQATVGTRGLSEGDQRGASSLIDALTGTIDFGTAGRMTLSVRAGQFLGEAGAAATAAADASEDAAARLAGINERRQAVAGVNLDEELAQMVVFQNSYAAAARIITTARDMYDILLSIGE